MQRSVVGAANLNVILQEAINPEGESLNRGGFKYRQGDRVMQIRNNYDKDVFNGDVGYIESVNMDDRSLTVRFEESGSHPLVDDPFRDASEKPCLYGYHQGKENLHYRGHHQGTGLFHPQHGRAEAEYQKRAATVLHTFGRSRPNSRGLYFREGIHEHMPIPQNEIDMSNGVVEQNPGY